MSRRVYIRSVQSCLMLATPILIMVVSTARQAASSCCGSDIPCAVSVQVTFAFYAGVAHKPMTASVVFTAVSLFNSLRIPLMFCKQPAIHYFLTRTLPACLTLSVLSACCCPAEPSG